MAMLAAFLPCAKPCFGRAPRMEKEVKVKRGSFHGRAFYRGASLMAVRAAVAGAFLGRK